MRLSFAQLLTIYTPLTTNIPPTVSSMGSGPQVSVVSAKFVLLNSSLDSLHSFLYISRRVLTRECLPQSPRSNH